MEFCAITGEKGLRVVTSMKVGLDLERSVTRVAPIVNSEMWDIMEILPPERKEMVVRFIADGLRSGDFFRNPDPETATAMLDKCLDWGLRFDPEDLVFSKELETETVAGLRNFLKTRIELAETRKKDIEEPEKNTMRPRETCSDDRILTTWMDKVEEKGDLNEYVDPSFIGQLMLEEVKRAVTKIGGVFEIPEEVKLDFGEGNLILLLPEIGSVVRLENGHVKYQYGSHPEIDVDLQGAIGKTLGEMGCSVSEVKIAVDDINRKTKLTIRGKK